MLSVASFGPTRVSMRGASAIPANRLAPLDASGSPQAPDSTDVAPSPKVDKPAVGNSLAQIAVGALAGAGLSVAASAANTFGGPMVGMAVQGAMLAGGAVYGAHRYGPMAAMKLDSKVLGYATGAVLGAGMMAMITMMSPGTAGMPGMPGMETMAPSMGSTAMMGAAMGGMWGLMDGASM